MKQALFGESPVDHHFQLDILRVLFQSESPVPFSTLKPDTTENSLFVYHLHKLEARGLIDHNAAGYWLTADGARRVNFVSTDTLKPDLSPRLLTSFLVFNTDKTRVLISRRLSAVAEYIGEYALPAGRQKYGVAVDDSAAERSKLLFGVDIPPKRLGNYETLYHSEGEYVHHVVAFLYELTLAESLELPAEDHYELLWAPLEEITAGKYGVILKDLLTRYISDEPFDGSVFSATA